jgi:hypothetical protein
MFAIDVTFPNLREDAVAEKPDAEFFDVSVSVHILRLYLQSEAVLGLLRLLASEAGQRKIRGDFPQSLRDED